jgi:hypothetical protein
VPDAEIALSAVAGGMLGLLRMCQRHPGRVDETTVDQLAEAVLRMLGVPAPEAARLAALPPPPTGHLVTLGRLALARRLVQARSGSAYPPGDSPIAPKGEHGPRLT